jgi:hypothetical protein
MNATSRGPLAKNDLFVGTTLAGALFAAFAAPLAGCPGPTPHGVGGASTTTGTTSGGEPCATAKDCTAKAAQCELATCDAKVCGVGYAPERSPCSEGGGSLCDGAGKCVACLVDDDCGAPTGDCKVPVCNAGVCETKNAPQASECTLSGEPTTGVCNAVSTCVAGQYVFVTSVELAPDFGGTEGADELCAKAAEKVGLGGTWLSWTADSESSPVIRFAQSQQPYRLLDDTVVAESWTMLTSADTTPLAHGIDMDQNHAAVGAVQVWTGAKPWGEYVHTSCENWTGGSTADATGDYGTAGETGYGWSWKGMAPCTTKGHLYCFQQ